MRLVLLLALATLATGMGASAQYVHWVQYINPTDRNDDAFGVCLFGDYLAVVGTANDDEFVALLDRATGEVIKTWVGGYGWLYNCLSVGDKLYVVGAGRIYIFDKGLNVVGKIDRISNSIAFDGEYLYLGGSVLGGDIDGDGENEVIWRVEKRALDLGLIAYREFYLRDWGEHGSIGDITVNPVTGDVWAVGYHYDVNEQTRIITSDHSLLVIFDKRLSVKNVIDYSRGHENFLGWLGGICFDEEGNAYVVSSSGVAKFDKYGNIVKVNRGVGGLKIACIGGRVYVFSRERMDNYWRHVLYVLDEELNLLGELVLSKGVEADSWFTGGRLAFDGRSLYAAGYDNAMNNTRIVIYSISLLQSIKVIDEHGRPMPGVLVKAVMGSRSFVNRTGEDGSARFSGVLPEKVYVYDQDGLLVGYAHGGESRVVVRWVGEVHVANSTDARGYVVFRGEFINGTSKSLAYEFTVSNGTMRIQGSIPLIYPVEVYITRVSVGAFEFGLEKPFLIYRGNASDLAKGINFAELGLTSFISIQAVDSRGSLRRDWVVKLLYGNTTIAEGNGSISVLVPRSDVQGRNYTVRVLTNAVTPGGGRFMYEQNIGVRQKVSAVQISVPTAEISAQVIDGFGNVRTDWPVEIVGVAAGHGSVGPVEVVAGMYVVKARAFGKEFNQTVTLEAGQSQKVTIRVPTAMLSVVLINEEGEQMGEPVSVEISGPVAYNSTSLPKDLEVLAGMYRVRAVSLGREIVETVALEPGDAKTVKVLVPSTKEEAVKPTTETNAAKEVTPTAKAVSAEVSARTDFSHTAALVAVAVAIITSSLTVVKLKNSKHHIPSEPPPEELCLEHQGGFIKLGGYTIVGRSNFDWLPDEVRGKIEEKHLAVYYRKGEWWVEDLGSRHGTYVNGVRVKKVRIGEGDVISPSAVVVLKVGKCGSVRMVRPMTEEDTTETFGGSAQGR